MKVKITGTGSCLPKLRVTNDDLGQIMETSDEWIRSRTGIIARHIAVEETTTGMSTEAADKALKNAEISAEDVDIIIAATVSADKYLPGLACEVQKNIGAENAVAFDINAACSGFLFALDTAALYLEHGGYQHALVIGAETLSKMMDWTDRSTCVLFGDGAGAAVLSVSEEDGILSMVQGSDGFRGDVLNCMARKVNNPYKKSDTALSYVSMNGQEVYRFAVKTVPKAITDAVEQADLHLEEMRSRLGAALPSLPPAALFAPEKSKRKPPASEPENLMPINFSFPLARSRATKWGCSTLLYHGAKQKQAERRFVTELFKFSGDAASDPFAHDAAVGVGGQAAGGAVEHGEHGAGARRDAEHERKVLKSEEPQNAPDHRLGKGEMDEGSKQRQEEHHAQLGVDACADVALCHADALHDGEAGGVLVALGELLVVEHQDGGEEEHRAEDEGEKEEAAVGGVELRARLGGDLTAHLGGEGADDVLRAEVEPRGGAEHDEDHGREDTDDGKSRAGALHTIDERGERDEVFLLVIEPVIALERAAEGNAARDEEKECRKDDHDDRHEENEHRGDRLGDGDGEVVGSAEKAQAGKDEEPLGSRRTLAEAVAAEKADRGGAAHLPPCVQEEKKEDKRIGQDAGAFFNNMALGNLSGRYSRLFVAPTSLKNNILALMDEQIAKGKDGYILLKFNSLTDIDVIAKLREASCAGVTVEMIVRGICCLLPGVPGHTENITVTSIVGRFLEHSRIYVFGRGDEEKMYISSADLMTRNTERRVEIACPIDDPAVRTRLHDILYAMHLDTVEARVLQPDGTYCKKPAVQDPICAQDLLMQQAIENARKQAAQPAPHPGFLEKIRKWFSGS